MDVQFCLHFKAPAISASHHFFVVFFQQQFRHHSHRPAPTCTASLVALVSTFTSDCTLISVRVLFLLPVMVNFFICITVTAFLSLVQHVGSCSGASLSPPSEYTTQIYNLHTASEAWKSPGLFPCRTKSDTDVTKIWPTEQKIKTRSHIYICNSFEIMFISAV